MAPRQTTTIKASITAYSTAVGPSSDPRKRRTFKASFFMEPPTRRRASNETQSPPQNREITREPPPSPRALQGAAYGPDMTILTLLTASSPRHCALSKGMNHLL